MHISLWNLRVLRGVIERHARKRQFLQGIVHARIMFFLGRLLKNLVFYEVSLSRLWHANCESLKKLCFYDGSGMFLHATYVFYDVCFKYMGQHMHFYNRCHISFFNIFVSNGIKLCVLRGVVLSLNAAEACLRKRRILQCFQWVVFLLVCWSCTLEVVLCKTRSRFLSARLAAGWTLWIWRKHAYLLWISRAVDEAEKAAASWKEKNNARHSRKLISRSSGRRRQGRQKGRWSRRMNAETSRGMKPQKSKKEKTQTDEEDADGQTANIEWRRQTKMMKKTPLNNNKPPTCFEAGPPDLKAHIHVSDGLCSLQTWRSISFCMG